MFFKVFRDKNVLLLGLLVVLLLFVSLLVGSTSVSMKEFLNLFNTENEILRKIIFQHRLPRALTALLTGIALPLSGWVLQEFFRNPLAGPSVLGVTSSAGLGVALVIVLGTSLGFGVMLNQPWAIILGALVGAFLSMFILLLVANKIQSTTALVIVGFMMAAFAGALIGVLEFFASGKELKSYVLWSFGSLNSLGFKQLLYYFICVVLGVVIIFKNVSALIKMQLGELYAKTMGVNVKSLRLQLIIASSILTGVATALVGPIAFIGLAVPHICRIYLKTSDFYRLFVYVVLLGMALMLVFSIISEMFPGGSLPINIITALFGAPIVLSILFNHNNQSV